MSSVFATTSTRSHRSCVTHRCKSPSINPQSPRTFQEGTPSLGRKNHKLLEITPHDKESNGNVLGWFFCLHIVMLLVAIVTLGFFQFSSIRPQLFINAAAERDVTKRFDIREIITMFPVGSNFLACASAPEIRWTRIITSFPHDVL